MSWMSRLFKPGDADSKNGPIGWTTAEMLAMAGDGAPQTWLVDRNHRFAFVLMPLAGVHGGVVEFDAERARLRLTDGAEVHPIGLAVCLDADFRGRVGQKLPSFLSTSRVTISQQSGSCYARVYALAQHQTPHAVETSGGYVELAPALAPSDGDGKPGGPERTQIEVKSQAQLRDHVPFAHAEGSLRGFDVCEQPAPGPGIVAAGSFKDMSIIVARMGGTLVANGAEVRSQDISAKLRDGSSVNALGMAVRIRMSGAPPFGWGDKLKIGPHSMSLEPGGTVNFMPQYAGPFSAIGGADCKVAAVFPAHVQLRQLLEIVIGSEHAGLHEGTLIRNGQSGEHRQWDVQRAVPTSEGARNVDLHLPGAA